MNTVKERAVTGKREEHDRQQPAVPGNLVEVAGSAVRRGDELGLAIAFFPLVGGGALLGLVHPSTLSTARNASCGISTDPTDFMRFLPSFCFSSSLRFREMSPP